MFSFLRSMSDNVTQPHIPPLRIHPGAVGCYVLSPQAAEGFRSRQAFLSSSSISSWADAVDVDPNMPRVPVSPPPQKKKKQLSILSRKAQVNPSQAFFLAERHAQPPSIGFVGLSPPPGGERCNGSAPGEGRRGVFGDGMCLVNEPPLPPLKESLSRPTAKTQPRGQRGALSSSRCK